MDIPSLGPRQRRRRGPIWPMPWAVEERHGWVWLAPERRHGDPARPVARHVRPSGSPPYPRPPGPCSATSTPPLERAWHPVALSRELRPGGWLQVRLLAGPGRCAAPPTASTWPPAFGVRERFGASGPPRPSPRRAAGPLRGHRPALRRALAPLRAPGRRPLADTLLDVAHSRSCTGRFGRRTARRCGVRVVQEPGGFSSTPGGETRPTEVAGGRTTPVAGRHVVYRALRSGCRWIPATGRRRRAVPPAARGRRLHPDLHLPVVGRPRGRRCRCRPSSQRGGLPARCWRRTSGLGVLAREGCRWTCARSCTCRRDRLGVALRRALCDFTRAESQRPCARSPDQPW